jgi:ankyrin repeat protein
MEGVCRTKAFAQILIVCLLLSFLGCAADVNRKPSPEAARQFLKLRGYNFDGKSFLSAAAANDVLAVNAFIAAGINPNARNEETGVPVLVSAAAHGDVEIVVNERDRAGFTALLRALQSKEDEVAEVLLAQQNLDLNAQGANGVTVLMSYAGQDRTDIVQSLLERTADVNLQDADGDTALHRAAQRGNVKTLEMLIAHGANPNVRNKLGGTPLMWAGVFGREQAARFLLEKGADASLKDENGITAAAWATKNKRDEVAQLLLEAEKKH